MKLTIKKCLIPLPLPWNGVLSGAVLENTCTIDNMLYFFHVLQYENKTIRNTFEKSHLRVEKILHKIHCLFKDNKWSEGKCLWASEVINLQIEDKVELYGNEGELSFNHVSDRANTAYKSTCSSSNCPEKVSLHVNKHIYFNAPSIEINNLQKAIDSWLQNDKEVLCNKDGCTGVRKHHPRRFVLGKVPDYFVLPLEFCPWQGNLPPFIKIEKQKFRLKVVTYGNGHHFNSSLNYNGKWFSYDGLREYHEPGTGVRLQTKQQAPKMYHPSHCLFVKE